MDPAGSSGSEKSTRLVSLVSSLFGGKKAAAKQDDKEARLEAKRRLDAGDIDVTTYEAAIKMLDDKLDLELGKERSTSKTKDMLKLERQKHKENEAAHKQKEEEKTTRLQDKIKEKERKRREKKQDRTALTPNNTLEDDEDKFSTSTSEVTVVSSSDLGEAKDIMPGASRRQTPEKKKHE